jgi:hypothetical protein
MSESDRNIKSITKFLLLYLTAKDQFVDQDVNDKTTIPRSLNDIFHLQSFIDKKHGNITTDGERIRIKRTRRGLFENYPNIRLDVEKNGQNLKITCNPAELRRTSIKIYGYTLLLRYAVNWFLWSVPFTTYIMREITLRGLSLAESVGKITA